MDTEHTYPGFNYAAEALSAFILSIDIFFIALKEEMVVQYSPPDTKTFEHWLSTNNIRNIKNQPL